VRHGDFGFSGFQSLDSAIRVLYLVIVRERFSKLCLFSEPEANCCSIRRNWREREEGNRGLFKIQYRNSV
jgi:hypothetical protein